MQRQLSARTWGFGGGIEVVKFITRFVWASVFAAIGAGPVAAQTCSRADFEAVVGEAAAALRSLNQTNKPNFQAQLRRLKEKRGWSHDQFLEAAAPIVQDDKIAEYDGRSSSFLARIEQLGAEGAQAATPDCKRLTEVHASMQELVKVQKEKWAYMFKKVEAELAR
ncbi:MAG: hypothetical protein R3D67_01580 [Hyphomicrobiaceae bacterium]